MKDRTRLISRSYDLDSHSYRQELERLPVYITKTAARTLNVRKLRTRTLKVPEGISKYCFWWLGVVRVVDLSTFIDIRLTKNLSAYLCPLGILPLGHSPSGRDQWTSTATVPWNTMKAKMQTQVYHSRTHRDLFPCRSNQNYGQCGYLLPAISVWPPQN